MMNNLIFKKALLIFSISIASSYLYSAQSTTGAQNMAEEQINLALKQGKALSFNKDYQKPSDAALRKKLSSLQYKVTQKEGTERPFDNEYWDHKESGIYVDIVSGEPLFSSKDKYKSGTGWPSFTKPIDESFIVEKEDSHLFYTRIELRSKFGDSHLGHVFNDGPQPTGLRYCINSASLRFIPVNSLTKQGYEAYLADFQ